MKTYCDCVTREAQHMFNKYMNGSNHVYPDSDMVAFIFELSVAKVNKDMNDAYEKEKSDYYARRAKK